ncbi:transposase [Saccharopolyspora hattusasensis]|uniref:transposase n=1 Tax=Saccharopolyspora hattusasensis TaxID=1128679 RepID=UPI003D99F98D
MAVPLPVLLVVAASVLWCWVASLVCGWWPVEAAAAAGRAAPWGLVAGALGLPWSLAALEILRPEVDRFVLDLLCTNGPMRYLSPKLFVEESDGHCRLVPPLTHLVAEQCLNWSRTIVPHAVHVARMLATGAKGAVRPATPIKRTRPRKYRPTTPLRLSGTVTVERIIPDHLWADIAPLLPAAPQRGSVGRPPADNRAVLAGIVCAEQLGCSYTTIPPTLGVSAKPAKPDSTPGSTQARGRLSKMSFTPATTSGNSASKATPPKPDHRNVHWGGGSDSVSRRQHPDQALQGTADPSRRCLPPPGTTGNGPGMSDTVGESTVPRSSTSTNDHSGKEPTTETP